MRTAYYRILLYIDSCTEHDVYYETAVHMLDHLDKVPTTSIQEIAALCYVSPSTISRFCRKVSFESYNDFKQKVVESLDYFERDFEYYFPNEKSEDNVLENHRQLIEASIEEAHKLIKVEDVQKLVHLIHSKKRIIFLGNYFTQNSALQLQMELAHFKKETYALYNWNAQLEMVKTATKDDLLIITSMTGQFLDYANEIMRQFKHSKASKVVISSGQLPDYLNDLDLYIQISKEKDMGNKFSILYLYELIELIYHFTYFKS